MADPLVTILLPGNPRLLFDEPKVLIYKIIHRASGKAYIGLTRRGIPERMRHHWKSSKREDSVLYRAFRKYGRKAFDVIILAIADAADDLPALEIKLIAEHRTFVDDGGYNMTRGGEGSPVICDEVRANMCAAAKKRMQDPAIRKKLSNALKGRKISPDHIAKSAAGRRGKPLSAEHRAKISEANKRRPPSSQAYRDKIANTLRGRPPPPQAIIAARLATKGKKRPPDVVERARTAANTPEALAKRSISLKAAWARRKLAMGIFNAE